MNAHKHEVSINGEAVEIVDTYKCVDSNLKFDKNTEAIATKSQQRIYWLRKLTSFNISEPMLCVSYRSFIESLLSFSFLCWFHRLSVKNKKSWNSIPKTCSRIIGVQIPN